MNTPLDEDLNFLAHYGKKGMKWGVRNTPQPTGKERKAARQEVASVGKTAHKIITEHAKAGTAAQRKAAVQKYEKEVFAKLKDPAFKKTWDSANTMSKGEKAVQLVAFGPLGALTIKSIKNQYTNRRELGLDFEIVAAKRVLGELKTL